ncbi:MAG TPA: YkvA family protein [Actinomycetota bacterium]|nr:YkvA family protein [Actinomycetota bacterium]
MRGVLITIAVVAAVWIVAIAALWIFGRKLAAAQLARAIPDVIALCRGLMRDPRVPTASKVLLGGALVWIASPIDLVPEFIPVLGPLDDVVVVGLVLRHLVKRAGVEVVQEHWRGEPRVLRAALRVAAIRLPQPDLNGARPEPDP